MIQAVDYSKYSGSSIRGLCHLMLSILYQIHIFDASYLTPDTHLRQLQTRLYPAESSCIQSYIRTKPSRRTPVKPGRHRPTRLRPSSSSQYPDYPIRKLTSFFTRGGGRLRPTGLSTSPPTVVLESGKPHASTSRQSADRLDNLSCIRISNWKYTFWVTYVLVATTTFYFNRWRRWYIGAELCLEKVNVEVNIKTHHVTCHVTSILKISVLAGSTWSRAWRSRYYI